MSGGADSSAAAAVLKEKGHEVAGITLSLWDDASRCCNYEDIMDAKKVCARLGIKHYTINAKKEFKEQVVDHFAGEYLKGRTPNPCIICNEKIKFELLIKKMKQMGFDRVATGHYCVIGRRNGRYILKPGKDRAKSQEYFLAGVKKAHLPFIVFPLGGLEKKEAVKKAEEAGLAAEKKESQEACFLKPGETPFEFITGYTGAVKEPAGLYSVKGEKLGVLKYGYYKYTIGQRKGLGYAFKEPLYVTAIDPEKNRVTAGPARDLLKKKFEINNVNIMYDMDSREFTGKVKIRYRQNAEPAAVKLSGKKGVIEFKKPVSAITPGQTAVFYKNNGVIGSGTIEKIIN